jgi:hypothetical protein
LIVPGWPQWSWRQPQRAAFFLGSYLAAVGVALFAWGTSAGYVILAAAFGLHVAATADAIGQWAFPGFGRLVPLASAGAGLGLGCYAPAVALASVLAWPSQPSTTPGEGFLINRWAYHNRHPGTGDWIWYDLPEGGGRGIGRLMAEEGRTVEWVDGTLKLDGISQDWRPGVNAPRPGEVAFVVPADHILVAPLGSGSHESTILGLILVDRHGVQGRAWARHSPVWNRKLLP